MCISYVHLSSMCKKPPGNYEENSTGNFLGDPTDFEF